MSVVQLSSDIKNLCDCPYAGKIREVKASAESEQRRRIWLRAALKDTNEDLLIAKNVLIDTRSKLAMLQRILTLELGWVINPFIMSKPTWKNRVREESYLKSELLHLVDYLRGCDPRFRTDLAIHPTTLSASTEDLLSATQEKILGHLYHGYTVYHTEDEKTVGKIFAEFLKMKENYENKLYHNKVMEKEIAAVKQKISDYQRQFLEDKCLIDYITDHHFKMKGCFLEVFPEKSPSNEDSSKVAVLDSEAMKFKKLWESSKLEKMKLLNYVCALKQNLEYANKRIIRAENVCSGNIIDFRVLANKIKEGIMLSKLRPKKKDHFGKFSLIHYRSEASQLEAARNENQYLRNFLRKAILSKTDDLKHYQQSLHSTAGKYRTVLADIRNEKLVEEAANAEKEKEKTPKKKSINKK